jgi:hypothetical protein
MNALYCRVNCQPDLKLAALHNTPCQQVLRTKLQKLGVAVETVVDILSVTCPRQDKTRAGFWLVACGPLLIAQAQRASPHFSTPADYLPTILPIHHFLGHRH